MTDYPRFEPVRGDGDTAHRHYHGASLVDFVFRLVDRLRGKPLASGAGGSPSEAVSARPGKLANYARRIDVLQVVSLVIVAVVAASLIAEAHLSAGVRSPGPADGAVQAPIVEVRVKPLVLPSIQPAAEFGVLQVDAAP